MFKISVPKILRIVKIRNLITLLVLVGLLALPMAARAATPQQPVGIGLYNAASGASYQAQLIVTYSLPDGTPPAHAS